MIVNRTTLAVVLIMATEGFLATPFEKLVLVFLTLLLVVITHLLTRIIVSRLWWWCRFYNGSRPGRRRVVGISACAATYSRIR